MGVGVTYLVSVIGNCDDSTTKLFTNWAREVLILIKTIKKVLVFYMVKSGKDVWKSKTNIFQTLKKLHVEKCFGRSSEVDLLL